MLYIVWKYNIEVKNRSEFENKYGKNGTWSNFFRRGKGYVETVLAKNGEGEYLVIDKWNTNSDYNYFMKNNDTEYRKMSDAMEKRISEEEKIGEYENIEEI